MEAPEPMTTQATLNKMSALQRDIQKLHAQLAREMKEGAAKTSRIAQIKRGITKATSPSALRSKLSEIERLENELARIQQKNADLNKQIADKTRKLHDYEQQLYAEQAKDQSRLLESIKRKEREDRARQDQLMLQVRGMQHAAPLGARSEATPPTSLAYDAFISHASEDKDDLVRPLAELLQKQGLAIWYDEFQLKVGDSLRRSIDNGLIHSRFGIVVLSPNFFAKNWPQYELDGLISKEMVGGKVVLPIWHRISKNDVIGYSPSLADKVALNTATSTVEELAEKLGEILRGT